MKYILGVSTLVVAGVAVHAIADLDYYQGNGVGIYDLHRVPGTTHDWVLSIYRRETGTDANFVIDADDPDDRLYELNLLYNPAAGSGQRVIVSIRDINNSSQFSTLKDVVHVNAASGAKLDFSIIRVPGNIGQADAMDNGFIVCDELSYITAGTGWYADVIVEDLVASPAVNSQVGAYALNDVLNGSFAVATGAVKQFECYGTVDTTLGEFGLFADDRIDRLVTVNSDAITVGSTHSMQDTDLNWLHCYADFASSTPLVLEHLGGLDNTYEDHPGGIDIDGDLDASITVNNPLGVDNPQTDEKAAYAIGGSLVEDAELVLPEGGLTTQIIINNAYNGGEWQGDVIVDGVTLQPVDDPNDAYAAADKESYYTNLSSELGGGQVGRAPFNFHQRRSAPNNDGNGDPYPRDCDPYQGEAVTAPYDAVHLKNQVIEDVRIRHYGPVYVDGSGPHFKVEFQPDVSPWAWVDRTGLFEVDTCATADNALDAHRDVVIRKTALNSTGFTASGHWRIRPIEGKVRCGGVDGNPDVGWVSGANAPDPFDPEDTETEHSWYVFRVLLEAPEGGMMLQGGTAPSSSDIAVWVESPYEVNADGETDAGDLADLSEAYGE